AGRMTTQDFITYVIAQVLGAIAGAIVLYLILKGKAAGWNGALGQNGWGPGYLGADGNGGAHIYGGGATVPFPVGLPCGTPRGARQSGSPGSPSGSRLSPSISSASTSPARR